jgi:hypothetical protein
MTEMVADPGSEMPERSGTPWHFWLAAVVSLLWNAFGGYDYTMTQLRDPTYMASVSEQMHVPVAELSAFFDSFPAWASALWAIGVWGSIAGSILLLIRSRHATTAFLVSLAGAVLSFIYQWTIDVPPEMTDDAMGKIMPIVIMGAIVLQWWYARRMHAAGVLR